MVWILYQTLKNIGVRTSWLSYDDDDRVVISGWGTWSAKGSFDVSFGCNEIQQKKCQPSSLHSEFYLVLLLHSLFCQTEASRKHFFFAFGVDRRDIYSPRLPWYYSKVAVLCHPFGSILSS